MHTLLVFNKFEIKEMYRQYISLPITDQKSFTNNDNLKNGIVQCNLNFKWHKIKYQLI